MSTLNQLIYNIRNFTKDAKSDDIKFTDRQYEFVINYLRSRLISQDIDKGKSISSNIKQDLGNIELIKVDSAEDNNLKANSLILRSALKLPKPIELNQKDAITYIGGIDKLSPIFFTTKSVATWDRHSKYASKFIHAFLKDQYLYLVNCTNLTKYITVEGIFEDPRAAYNFKNPIVPYNADLEEYPLSTKMIQTINDLFKEKELDLFLQLPQDTLNDASTNTNDIINNK